MTRRMRVAMPLLVVMGLLLVTTSGVMAAAAEDGATIPALTEVAQVGELPGDASGSYRYYQVAYPGGQAEVTIELRYWPNDPVLAQAVGFNVYGPDSEERGEPQEDGSYLECAYAADDAATLLVQVYNYVASTVTYEIVANGVAAPAPTEAPAATAPAEPTAVVTPTAEAEATTEAADTARSGEVVGSRAGAYAVYPIAGSDSGADITVTMTFSPDDPSLAGAVGFNVYSPAGKLVAAGSSTSVVGQRVATFVDEATGDYTVQVYNYLDGLTLGYSLEVDE